MKEATFWSDVVRPALHAPAEHRVAWKVQDAFNKGLPDVFFNQRGAAGLIEMKYAAAYPVRATTPLTVAVTPEQRRQLREWSDAGGAAYVLFGVGVARGKTDWYLLPPTIPERLTRDELEVYAACCGSRGTIGTVLPAYLMRDTSSASLVQWVTSLR